MSSYGYNPITGKLDRTGGGGGGALPANVPQAFATPNGTAIPVAHVLNVESNTYIDPSNIQDNDYGLDTYVDPDGSNNLYFVLTNRQVATGQVTGAVTEDIFTQDLGGAAGVYNFQVYVAGYEITTPAGCAFTIFGSVRTTGAAATIIVQQDIISDKETALLASEFFLVVSGNNIIGRATGVTGLTINYKILANYIFIG